MAVRAASFPVQYVYWCYLTAFSTFIIHYAVIMLARKY